MSTRLVNLRSSVSGIDVWVNPEYVSSVSPRVADSSSGYSVATQVEMSSGKVITVEGEPREVIEMLKNASR